MPESEAGFQLMELSPYQCRWPINTPEKGELYLFCGASCGIKLPYCKAHSRIAYRNYLDDEPTDNNEVLNA